MFDDGFVDDTEEMMKMAMSKKSPYLSSPLCCAASTPEPAAGVTWASSRVLSRAKRLRSGLGSVGVREWHYMISRGRKDVREFCVWDDSRGILKTETCSTHGRRGLLKSHGIDDSSSSKCSLRLRSTE
jgi:hypothetical protein